VNAVSSGGAEAAVTPARIISVVAAGAGTGRTSAVVNVACILARAGARVLVLGLDPEPPNAESYLAPFKLVQVRSHEQADADLGPALARLIQLPRSRPNDPAGQESARRAWRCGLPQTRATFDLVQGALAIRTGATGNVTAIRQALQSAPVDFVFVDHPTSVAAQTSRIVASLSDVAIVAFRINDSTFTDGLLLAHQIGIESAERVRVIAMPTHVREPLTARDEKILAMVATSLHGSDGGAGRPEADQDARGEDDPSPSIVPVPHSQFEAAVSQAPLAVLVERPGRSGTQLAAYERLARALSPGIATGLALIPDRVRRRYLRELGLDQPGPADQQPELAVLDYRPADRPWADWLRAQLKAAAIEVDSRTGSRSDDPGAGPDRVPDLTVRLIGSSEPPFDPGPSGPSGPSGGPSGPSAGATGEVFRIRVAPYLPPGLLPGRSGTRTDHEDVLDLSRQAEDSARGQIRHRLGLIAATAPVQAPVRYPGRAATPITNLASLRSTFVGRGADLERVRDALVEPDAPLWITGSAGQGKSALAREYARLFGFDYDVVWWVDCGTADTVRAGLKELVLAAGVPDGGDPLRAVQDLLLVRKRCLLVYDNADDVESIEPLIPAIGRGHVIVTSRAERGTGLALAGLDRADGVALLASGVDGLTPADAERTIEAIGQSPMDLQIAGAWLRQGTLRSRHGASTVRASAASSVQQLIDDLAEQEALASGPRAAIFERIAAELNQFDRGTLALRLAELCSFLDPDEIPLPLLTAGTTIAQIVSAGGADAGALARDSSELHRVIQTGVDFRLFELDWSRNRLQMHRITQGLLLGSMSARTRDLRRDQILRALAAQAPTEADAETAAWSARLAQLAPHVTPSGAEFSGLRVVRRWLIQHVRFQYREGDSASWRSTAELSRRLLQRWEGSSDADLMARLRIQYANLERALGHNETALAQDDDALGLLRRTLGVNHPRALIAARGRGGDLRALGRFDEALDEDEGTYLGFRRAYGEDHPDTLMSANNLALSTFLNGDFPAALALALENAERRSRLFGLDHPLTIGTWINVAVYRCELGDLDGAEDLLLSLFTRMNELESNHAWQSGGPVDRLRIERNRAIVKRRSGIALSALEDDERIRTEYEETLGRDHPGTRATLAGLAADCYAVGDHSRAVSHGERALMQYRRALGRDDDHPFVRLCQGNLGIFLRAGNELKDALTLGQAGYDGLRNFLHYTHPWSIAAANNLAGHLYAANQREQALELLGQARGAFTDSSLTLVSGHRLDRALNRNLQVIERSEPAAGLQDIEIDIPET
jgi:hypothetical protein